MVPAGAYHVPAMPGEVMKFLNPHGGSVWLDCTCGAGGHGRLICERLSPEGIYLGLDRDPRAIEATGKTLAGVQCRAEIRRAHFRDAGRILDEFGGEAAGALWDLGLSSDQIERGKGFSPRDLESPLDMRQDPDGPVTAEHILNRTPEKQLADIIFRLSDERMSRRIARSIAERRPLRSVRDLVEAIRASLPRGYRRGDDVNRRVFQAIRAFVNEELEQLAESLREVTARLKEGGRAVVLAYHGREDAEVKRFFREGSASGEFELLTKKPVRPSPAEVRENSRARSARLRAVEKKAPA